MIVHVLADGRRVDNIQGHVVKTADAKDFYEIINRIIKEVKLNEHQEEHES